MALSHTWSRYYPAARLAYITALTLNSLLLSICQLLHPSYCVLHLGLLMSHIMRRPVSCLFLSRCSGGLQQPGSSEWRVAETNRQRGNDRLLHNTSEMESTMWRQPLERNRRRLLQWWYVCVTVIPLRCRASFYNHITFQFLNIQNTLLPSCFLVVVYTVSRNIFPIVFSDKFVKSTNVDNLW